ncbi:MAG: hypothetical protein AAFO07_25845, partial [Bacteroidota bacterium]
LEKKYSQGCDHSILTFLNHFLNFPLSTWLDLLPAGILILFLIPKRKKTNLLQHPFIRFCIWISIVNFVVYWISPGSRQRYVYMLYPLFVMTMLYAYYQIKEAKHWTHRFFKWFVRFIVGVLILVAIAINFIPDLQFLKYLLPLSIVCVLSYVVLLYFNIRTKIPPIATLILATIIARFIFDLAIIPQRNYRSDALDTKNLANEIYQTTKEEPLYLYWTSPNAITNNQDIDLIAVYYLNFWRKDVLKVEADTAKEGFFIAKKADLGGQNYEAFMEFEMARQEFVLIRFN